MSKVCLLKDFTYLKTDNLRFALRQTSSTCFPQSNVEDKYRPRCLCKFTLSINVPLNIKGGELFRTLFVKIMSFVFDALNCTFHFAAHKEIFSRSLFRICAVSEGSNPLENRLVSSAKIKISLSMSLTISFDLSHTHLWNHACVANQGSLIMNAPWGLPGFRGVH